MNTAGLKACLFLSRNSFPEKAQRMSTAQKKDFQEVGFAAAVLRQEAHALTMMARGLDAAFCSAVDCLYGINGRIAVTGMGKSGHVAR